MKLKKDYSLFARAAETLTGAGRVAAVLLVMLFSMTAQTVWAESATVTQANFSNFFDEDGYLLDAVTSDELIFQGEFSNSGYVIIKKPITITGDNAVLKNMGFVIISENVTLDKMTLTATTSLGDLIYVGASNVALTNLTISYEVGNVAANVINVARDINGVNISKNSIYFESHATTDEDLITVINLDNVKDVIVNGNTIDANMPSLNVETYDYSYFMMGLCNVNPVRIYESDNVALTNNKIDVTVNSNNVSYPTVQALYIVGSEDILVEGNDFKMVDTLTPAGTPIYLYAVECGFSEGIEFIKNNFDISTTGCQSGSGSIYVLQVVTSEATIIGNHITSESDGPNLGIISPYGFGPAKDLIIKENVLNITGLATGSSSYALISGIEIETGYATISNNTINVHNKEGYSDSSPVSGISAVQYSASTLSFDIQDNNIYVPDGKYAVDIRYAPSEATVIGNALCAHELTGDDAVYIKSGNNNTVENNVHGYVNMPKTGEDTYNIPANVPSFKVYDDGGTSRKYSPGCAGTLKLTAPEGFQLQLSGNIKTEKSADYLTVYDGSSNQAAKLINQVSSSDNGTLTAIPTVISTGRNMTIYFCSNNSNNSEYDGLNLTVTVVKFLSETTGITDAASLRGKTAQFSRTFTSGVASTICLPFPMTGLAEDMVYEMTSMDKNGEDWEATMSAVTSTVAGKPYLIKTDGEVVFSGTVPNDFDGTAGTSSATYSGDGSWTFRGTYTTLTYGTNLDGAVYGFAGVAYNGGSYSVSPGDFVKAESGAYISPFRCYLTYNAPSQARGVTRGADIELPSRIIVRLVGSNGQTTAIGSMDTRTGEVVFGDAWYTLDGRKLNGKPNAKGLFIHDGKKVVIK